MSSTGTPVDILYPLRFCLSNGLELTIRATVPRVRVDNHFVHHKEYCFPKCFEAAFPCCPFCSFLSSA